MLPIFQIGFLHFTFWDILDILIVGYLLFQIYKLLKGTLGFNIFLALTFIYVLWWFVAALGMPMLSNILGQFVSVGIIALLIIFQPEARRFLVLVGQNSLSNRFFNLIFKRSVKDSLNPVKERIIREIVRATEEMSDEKTGALMLITEGSNLEGLYSSGILLNADISAQLLLSIFNKNSPLHDGAAIIAGNHIVAASCVLPVSDRPGIPQSMGLRHRAAIGITETANTVAFIVSEESGQISFARRGEIISNISTEQMSKLLRKTINI